MHIESPDGSEPGRKQNRNRGNLGGKKEQMRKIGTISVISVLLAAATVLTLALLSGCTKMPEAVTPLSAPGMYPTGSYYGGGAGGYFPLSQMGTPPSPFLPPSFRGEVWVIARREPGVLPDQDAPGSGAVITDA